MNIKETISRRPWILAVLVSLAVVIWMLSGLNDGHEITTDTSQISAPGEAGGQSLRFRWKHGMPNPLRASSAFMDVQLPHEP